MRPLSKDEERPSEVIARAKVLTSPKSSNAAGAIEFEPPAAFGCCSEPPASNVRDPATDLGAGSEASATASDQRRILLVDDQPSVLRAIARVLALRGYQVETASNGAEAIRKVASGDFDVVLSDIAMPEMDGITLLREIRVHNLYVPVILITGEPTLDTAVQALEHGAIHYLTKPLQMPLLEGMLDKAIRLRRMTEFRLRAAEVLGRDPPHAADRSGLEMSFRRMLGTLWAAFQPIVDARTKGCIGFEALLRSDEPSLPHPAAVLEAAKRLGQLEAVGRAMRDRVAEVFNVDQRSELLFVNLHVADLLDPHLLSPNSALSKLAPQVVLEITERAVLDGIGDVASRIAALRELGYRVAIDDLGAGYSGLNTFALLEPDYIKLDMELIRDIDQKPMQQRIVRSMITLCRDMGRSAIVEGVETDAEFDVLRTLGCELFQGYLFARPGPGFPRSNWPPGRK
jgi:EAL domain-containing protein (putative c-di-GMP-specific phosphodiesterase class I)/ActR/RegA family two-component response regulator